MTPPTPWRLAALLLSLSAATTARAQLPPPPPSKEDQAKIASLQRLLTEIEPDRKAFQKRLPVAHFLHLLEKQLPKDKRISLRLDAEAFGKDFNRVAALPIQLQPAPRRLSAILHQVCSYIRSYGIPADYRIWPTHFAITTPEKARYTHIYDVRDLLDRSLLLELLERNGGVFALSGNEVAEHLKDTDGAHLLVHLILCTTGAKNWSGTATAPWMIRVVNGTQLVVYTNSWTHEAINDLLRDFRRLRDLAVVMNARLYEVDRAFYGKHIAPLLATGVRVGTVRLAAPIHDQALLKQVKQQAEVVREGDLKIRPSQPTEFLGLQEPYLYIAHPGNPNLDELRVYRTGLTGVSFRVRATVSRRRSMHLKITQEVAELLEIKKCMVLEPATGKEWLVESPNVRRNTLTAMLTIDDGQAFVMPVDYRPPGAARDRLWILLAEPIVWIEEEQEQIRLGNLADNDGSKSPQGRGKTNP